MIERVVVRPRALEHIAEAMTWYEDRCPGLGEDFMEEVIAAISRAQHNPELFRIVRARDAIRQVLTKRFPYRVLFSIIGSRLYVYVVLHGARDDRLWRKP